MNEPRRIRSPNYPALSLAEAIQRVGAIHERERTHPMSKEVALKGMGYSGVNGAALGTLSAVAKYGLLDKDGDTYRVSQRAVSILHPGSEGEKEQALREAALAPTLFNELNDQFPGGAVSDDNLRSYLIRRDFSSGAVSAVIKTFRETMQMISSIAEKSRALPLLPAPVTTETSLAPRHFSMAPNIAPVAASASSSPWMVSFDGLVLTVGATLDNEKAVDKLIKVLEANKLLLPKDEPHEGSDEGEAEH